MLRIWELRHNVTAYDAAYIALAEALGAPLLTRDAVLASAPGNHARIELIRRTHQGSEAMGMHNPAHPGEILKELVIDPLGPSVTDAAHHLGVNRKTLSKVLNGIGTVTPEMALRFEMTFGKPNAAYWLRLQNASDFWQARRHSRVIHVSPITVRAG